GRPLPPIELDRVTHDLRGGSVVPLQDVGARRNDLATDVVPLPQLERYAALVLVAQGAVLGDAGTVEREGPRRGVSRQPAVREHHGVPHGGSVNADVA